MVERVVSGAVTGGAAAGDAAAGGAPRWSATAAAYPVPGLDADQQAAVTAFGDGGDVVVVGAPGSGRTTTALAAVRGVLDDGVPPELVLLLTQSRRAAAALRDRLAATTPVTTGQPVVRTPASLAFAVLRARAVAEGASAPVLVSGPEQDAVLAELLSGHLAGHGVRLDWPEGLPVHTAALPAFRAELRDVLMRAAERGLDGAALAELGRRRGEPAWVLAGQLGEEYRANLDLRTGATPDVGELYDPAGLVQEAVDALTAWPAGCEPPRWSAVVVDDYQDVTRGTASLLARLAADGARLMLLGDPDVAVQTHRGADPRLLAMAADELAALGRPAGVTRVVLRRVWRQTPALRAVTSAVVAGIGVSGLTEHRRAVAVGAGRRDGAAAAGAAAAAAAAAAGAPGDPPVLVARLPTGAQHDALVAHTLRSAVLRDGLRWSDLAVVVRSGAQVAALRSSLVRAGVPVVVPGIQTAVRDEAAVRPLLSAMRCAVAWAQADWPQADQEPWRDAADPAGAALAAVLDPATAAELLTSPLGGMDAITLRRLRRALRRVELAAGGGRGSDALLIELLADPRRAGVLPAGLRRGPAQVAGVLAAGRDAAGAAGATAHTVLWALWQASGLAEVWRRLALAGGEAGQRADRDLDAVLALFTAAERYTTRLPQSPPAAFLDHLAGQELPEDSLAPRAPEGDAVTVCTAAGTDGREWELVIVAGVQEGTWPDLRLRDSLLGAQRLADLLDGRSVATDDPRAARRAVLDDELRTFAAAVSRARSRLLVTAVQNEEEHASLFLDLVQGQEVTTVPLPLDLRGLVAGLRAELTGAAAAVQGSASAEDGPTDRRRQPGGQDPADDGPAGGATARRDGAATVLAALAAAGAQGADPAQWYGLPGLSTDAPLYGQDEVVTISPSSVEQLDLCPLRWALESAGGQRAEAFEQSLGTLVHDLASRLPAGPAELLRAELEASWPALGLGSGWLVERERRKAEAMVDRLAAYVTAHADVEGVEVAVDVVVGLLRLRGRIDRLERTADGALRVVDFKTGSSVPSVETARQNPQLGTYQVALAEDPARAEDVAGAALVYLGAGAKGPTVREQGGILDGGPGAGGEPSWAHELLARVRSRVTAADFLAQANQRCDRCPVRRSCPVQDEGGQVVA